MLGLCAIYSLLGSHRSSFFSLVFVASMCRFTQHIVTSSVSFETVEFLAESFSSLRAIFRFCFSILYLSRCSTFSLLIAFFSSISNRFSSFRFFSSSFTLLYASFTLLSLEAHRTICHQCLRLQRFRLPW